jgi:WD40 repeat protein
VAVVLARRASTERDQATSALRSEQIARLASDAEAVAGTNIDLASLLALEAYQLADRPDTLSALETVLRAQPAIRGITQIVGLPADAVPLQGDQSGPIAVYDSAGKVLPVSVGSFGVGRSLQVPGSVDAAAVSPDGRTVAITTLDGTVISADVETGRLGRSIHLLNQPTSVSFLSDNKVAVAGYGNIVSTVDLRSGATSSVALNVEYDTNSSSIVVTADPRRQLIAVSLNNPLPLATTPLDVISAGSLTTIHHLELPVGGVNHLAFQPGKDLLAVSTTDHGVLLVNTRTGRQVPSPGRSALGASVLFSPDGRRLAVLDQAGILNVYDVSSRRPIIAPVTEAMTSEAALHFAPDGRSLYELSSRQVTGINLEGSQPLAPALFAGPGANAGGITPNGTLAYALRSLPASGYSTFSSTPYDPVTGLELGKVIHEAIYECSPNGLFAIGFNPARPAFATFGPNGRLIANSSGGGLLAINRSLTVMLTIAPQQDFIVLEHLPEMKRMKNGIFPNGNTLTALELSDDGTLVARAGTPNNGTAAAPPIVDVGSVNDGRTIVRLQMPVSSPPVTVLAFTPDARYLAVGSATGSIGLLDTRSGNFVAFAYQGIHGAVQQLFFSADGQHLFASGSDGTVWWWDTTTHTPIGNPFPTVQASASIDVIPATFDLTGHWLLTTETHGLRRWNLDTESWPALACRRAGRNLTRQEWARYLPTGLPYKATCPDTK